MSCFILTISEADSSVSVPAREVVTYSVVVNVWSSRPRYSLPVDFLEAVSRTTVSINAVNPCVVVRQLGLLSSMDTLRFSGSGSNRSEECFLLYLSGEQRLRLLPFSLHSSFFLFQLFHLLCVCSASYKVIALSFSCFLTVLQSKSALYM